MGQEENLHDERVITSFNAVMFDDMAFEKFFRKHFTPLCAYCQYKFGFDIEQSKDIVHNGFIKLWENRQTISPELFIKAYLYKIITNISLDILKREKVRKKHIRHLIDNAAEESTHADYNNVDYKQLGEQIRLAVSEMPEQMRNVFELCRYQHLKCSEVALLLGISVKTVETHMSRALIKLRQRLAQYLLFCPAGIFLFR